MTPVLITGSKGQLGSVIAFLSNDYPDIDFTFTDIEELDLTNQEEIEKIMTAGKFRVVINCAAYTAVDKAETDSENAGKVNTLAAKNLAIVCASMDVMLVHVSTDYVFDGTNSKPYNEDDAVSPLGVYGKTKWEGEEEIRRICKRSVIIRTSWLYSAFGNNFVKTVLRLSSANDTIRIVFDQVGTPTFANDLANLVLSNLDKIADIQSNELFHYSNEGVASWYDFACAIVKKQGLATRVNPIMSSEYPTPAARPHYSLLNKKKIKEFFNTEIPYWQESLQICLDTLNHIDKS